MLPLLVLSIPVHVEVPGVLVEPLQELSLGHLFVDEEVCDVTSSRRETTEVVCRCMRGDEVS